MLSLIRLHRQLIADTAGQEAFRCAIETTVHPGEVFLDVGTGTGLHSVFASQAGASKVFAIDSAAVIDVARQIVGRNGCDDIVEVIQSRISDLSVPVHVDVACVHMGLADTLAAAAALRRGVIDVSTRLIPRRIDVFCAPVSTIIHDLTFWERAHFGVTFEPMAELARNVVFWQRIGASELLADGVLAARFELARPITLPVWLSGTSVITHDGECTALGLWYIEDLSDAVSISTAPPCSLPVQIWPNRLLPIAPIQMRAGDVMQFSINTDFGTNPAKWGWTCAVQNEGRTLHYECRRGNHGGLTDPPRSAVSRGTG